MFIPIYNVVNTVINVTRTYQYISKTLQNVRPGTLTRTTRTIFITVLNSLWRVFIILNVRVKSKSTKFITWPGISGRTPSNGPSWRQFPDDRPLMVWPTYFEPSSESIFGLELNFCPLENVDESIFNMINNNLQAISMFDNGRV